MKVSRTAVVISIVVLELMGTVIFLKGFFPIKAAVPGHATLPDKVEPHITETSDSFNPNPGTLRTVTDQPLFGRLVLILIDALRADFVIPESSSKLPRMKFVGELMEKGMTHTFIAKARPPTVTMPRIKVPVL